jgi:hypothetical protein
VTGQPFLQHSKAFQDLIAKATEAPLKSPSINALGLFTALTRARQNYKSPALIHFRKLKHKKKH